MEEGREHGDIPLKRYLKDWVMDSYAGTCKGSTKQQFILGIMTGLDGKGNRENNTLSNPFMQF